MIYESFTFNKAHILQLSRRSAPARSCGVGAGRRFYSATWRHWYPLVSGCEVDVMLVRCQWLLKYNFNEILHHNERKVIRVESYRSNGSLIKY
jgi:hypothetical protein